MRGEILSVDGLSGDGLISGDDGARYAFVGSAARQSVQAGDRVDFVVADGVATEVMKLAGARETASSAPSSRRSDRASSDLGLWGHFTRSVRTRYADGEGRATRTEYWSFILFNWIFIVVPVALGFMLDAVLGLSDAEGSGPFAMLGVVIAAVVFLGLWLPGLCVLIRRFHDVGLTGWLVLLGVIPYVGGLITFVITVLDSQSRPNKHGPVPGSSHRSTAEVFS